MERHQDFPNVWEAALIIALLFGVQILIATAFYDAGERFSIGDPKFMGIISVLGCGVIFSILLTYKNLGYAELFHSSARSLTSTMWPLSLPLLVTTAGSVLSRRHGGRASVRYRWSLATQGGKAVHCQRSLTHVISVFPPGLDRHQRRRTLHFSPNPADTSA